MGRETHFYAIPERGVHEHTKGRRRLGEDEILSAFQILLQSQDHKVCLLLRGARERGGDQGPGEKWAGEGNPSSGPAASPAPPPGTLWEATVRRWFSASCL